MRLTDIEEQVRSEAPPIEGAEVSELRAERTRLGGLESQVSFLRRVVQSRVDLIAAALAAQDDAPGAAARLGALLSAVPELLVRGATGGSARSPRHRGLVDPDLELIAEIDTDAAIALVDVPGAAADDLRHELARLEDLARRVSDVRQRLHRSIDVIQADIARRYRVGELSVSG